jgi:hypothetical protein
LTATASGLTVLAEQPRLALVERFNCSHSMQASVRRS